MAWAIQLRRNVAAVASRWQHCVRFDRPGKQTQNLPRKERGLQQLHQQTGFRRGQLKLKINDSLQSQSLRDYKKKKNTLYPTDLPAPGQESKKMKQHIVAAMEQKIQRRRIPRTESFVLKTRNPPKNWPPAPPTIAIAPKKENKD